MSTSTTIQTGNANTRIVKNTLFLFLKQVIVLYAFIATNRIILDALGATDFGLRSSVTTIVMLFYFPAIGNATSRYIAYAVGKGDENDLKRVFSSSFFVHLIYIVLAVLFCESIGLWFLNSSVNIPEGRMTAALWTFHLFILSFAVGEIRMPFEAEIMAHEKMGFYAFLSVFDVAIMLLLILLIKVIPFDSLILSGIFYLFVKMIITVLMATYCIRNYPETHSVKHLDRRLILKMVVTAALIAIGGLATIVWPQHRATLLCYSHCGVTILAAVGIVTQLSGTISGFINNFQIAVSPQITKTYAVGNLERMHKLVVSSSKFTYFLFFIVFLPLCLEAKQVLLLWLPKMPEQTVLFLQLALPLILINLLLQTLHTANLATGNLIKILAFQLIKGVLPLTPLFLLTSWTLNLKLPAEAFYIIPLLVTTVIFIIQLFIIRWSIGLSLRHYCNEVFVRALLVSIIASILPILAFISLPDTLTSAIIVASISIISVGFCVYRFGLNTREKEIIKGIILHPSEIVQTAR